MRQVSKIICLLALAGCSDDHRRPELRAALDSAQITLRDSVGVAMLDADGTAALEARLVMEADPIFSVGVLREIDLRRVDIDIVTGLVRSTSPAGTASLSCPGAIPLDEALAVAEDAAGGDAVAVVPDDDVACAREIQVLKADVLWEVKVGGDGAVLEQELSDEYSGSED